MTGTLTGRRHEDVSATVQQILANEGVEFRLNAECMSVAKREGGVAVGVDCEEDSDPVLGRHLLLAVGRVPNTGDPGLGMGGDEVVQSLLDVMYADVPYTVIQRAVHIHPTVAELVPTLLGQLKPLA